MKTRAKHKSRLIDLQETDKKFHLDPDANEYISTDFLDPLIDLHTFTGCGTVSSFSGKGKVTAVKCLLNSPEHIKVFKMPVSYCEVSEDLMHYLESFTK